jgi:2-polyprenyl-3-methyl-5-hydroxy-6-metoxy-1,4-benzoquinol methylase
MIDSHGRSTALELIDLGPDFYSAEEYRDCLYQLDRIGRYLGGDRATMSAFDRLQSPPASIVDVGCGGGFFTLKLAKRYPSTRVVGIDINPQALEVAREHQASCGRHLSNLSFEQPELPTLIYPPKSIDVITATLLCHHLPDDILIDFLKRSYAIASQAIILNDLHRHWLAPPAFACATALFFRNRLVKHDGQLSICRAFTYDNWIYYLKAAGIPLERCTITWHWAFRWIVFVDTAEGQGG